MSKYIISVTPKNKNFPKHIWTEGGIFDKKEGADFQVKELKKTKMYSASSVIELNADEVDALDFLTDSKNMMIKSKVKAKKEYKNLFAGELITINGFGPSLMLTEKGLKLKYGTSKVGEIKESKSPLNPDQSYFIKVKGTDMYIGSPNIIKKDRIWVPNYQSNKGNSAVVKGSEVDSFLKEIPLKKEAFEFEEYNSGSSEKTTMREFLPSAYDKPFNIKWEAFKTGSGDWRKAIVSYDKDNFIFLIIEEGNRTGIKMREKDLVFNLNNKTYQIDNGESCTSCEKEKPMGLNSKFPNYNPPIDLETWKPSVSFLDRFPMVDEHFYHSEGNYRIPGEKIFADNKLQIKVKENKKEIEVTVREIMPEGFRDMSNIPTSSTHLDLGFFTDEKSLNKYLDSVFAKFNYVYELKETRAKVKLKELTIHWAEGNTSLYDRFPQKYNSWESANKAVLPVYYDSVKDGIGGYNKLKFSLVFNDGEPYEGRLDVSEKEDNPLSGNVFGKHIKDFLEYELREDSRASEESKKEVRDFLRKYDLGIDMGIDVTTPIASPEQVSESLSDCLTRNGINLEKDHHKFDAGTKVKDLLSGSLFEVSNFSESEISLVKMSAFAFDYNVDIKTSYNKMIDHFKDGNISVSGFEPSEIAEFARVLNTIQHCIKMDKLHKENEELKSKKVIPVSKFNVGEKVLYTSKLAGFDNSKPLIISYKAYREADPSSFVEEGWSYNFEGINLSSYEKNLKEYSSPEVNGDKPKYISIESMTDSILSKSENNGLLKSGKYSNSESGIVAYIKDQKQKNPDGVFILYGVNSSDIIKYLYDKAGYEEKLGIENAREASRAVSKIMESVINPQLKNTNNSKETIAGLKTLLSLTSNKEEKKKIKAEIENIEEKEARSYIEKGKEYSAAVDIADERLKSIIAGNTSGSGMVNDKTKGSKEYKKAKSDYDKAFSAYRDFNKSFSNKIKSKAAEIRMNEKMKKNNGK